MPMICIFFFSSRRRHTRLVSDWSSDVCSSDLRPRAAARDRAAARGRHGDRGGRYHGDRLRGLEPRSEERRVGKEWRYRWSPEHEKKKERSEATQNHIEQRI